MKGLSRGRGHKGSVRKNLRPSASLLGLPAHGVASERRADTRLENPALGTRGRDGRCAGSRLRAARHRRGAEAGAPARLGCNSQARAAPGGTGAKPVGTGGSRSTVAAPTGDSAAAGPRRGLVLTSGKPPKWRHMASQPCAAWTYGTGFGQKWRHVASHGVTALCRLDLRHETRARPGRQAHPAIATVSGRPPPRNPSP